ncbi:MAG: hypothetical protein RIR96_1371 [Bacteroidota bacterium]|jgi:hypothetical protein
MANPTVFEKLQYNNEKNLLIQGLPSSLEKQFIKLSFAKSVTPLLRSRKVDFAIVFAVSQKQLCGILNEIMSALSPEAKLWISYPKPTAKIVSDLCREAHWQVMDDHNLIHIQQIELDNVWCATQFSFTYSGKQSIQPKITEVEIERPKSRRVSTRSRVKEVAY